MLFCKSSTVKFGTIALICTASCVVATIASFSFVVFIHPQATGPRPDLQARPCGVIEETENLHHRVNGVNGGDREHRGLGGWSGRASRGREVGPNLARTSVVSATAHACA